MDRVKLLALTSGTVIIIYGYWLLAVSADLSVEAVIIRAEAGMLSVLTGGVLLLAGILRRS